jgi:hypothetical protein
MEKRIILLDLNYTLVSNQQQTRLIKPFSARLDAEEYRPELLEAIKDDYVIIITARPSYQQRQTMENVYRKTGWKPQEAYFNDLDYDPPTIKRSILKRFVFPKHGTEGNQYFAVESNPRTREMYAEYGIKALPYNLFLNKPVEPEQPKKKAYEQLNMFAY